jgi:hypothetical protein
MADAFGYTFWWALGLLVAALAFSTMLPKRKPANASAASPVPLA